MTFEKHLLQYVTNNLVILLYLMLMCTVQYSAPNEMMSCHKHFKKIFILNR
jgi:hypothetical protein